MKVWISILVMAIATYLMRVLPLTLIRRPIKNRFFRSFLYYVPYVTLAVMTVPAIFTVTESTAAGVLALVAGLVAAWCGMGLLPVAAVCCVVVLVAEYFV